MQIDRGVLLNMNKKKKRKVSIDDTIKRIDEYNKVHGTRFSYGKYKALERLGKIKE